MESPDKPRRPRQPDLAALAALAMDTGPLHHLIEPLMLCPSHPTLRSFESTAEPLPMPYSTIHAAHPQPRNPLPHNPHCTPVHLSLWQYDML